MALGVIFWFCSLNLKKLSYISTPNARPVSRRTDFELVLNFRPPFWKETETPKLALKSRKPRIAFLRISLFLPSRKIIRFGDMGITFSGKSIGYKSRRLTKEPNPSPPLLTSSSTLLTGTISRRSGSTRPTDPFSSVRMSRLVRLWPRSKQGWLCLLRTKNQLCRAFLI